MSGMDILIRWLWFEKLEWMSYIEDKIKDDSVVEDSNRLLL